jgi:competence protein ComFB
MEIHNMTESWVIEKVNSVCDSIEKDDANSAICTCEQCRQDTVCYVLNRATPYYVVSHRGMTRANQESFAAQQNRVDLTALVYEGLRLVNHNQRSYANHSKDKPEIEKNNSPLFNIPAIGGRILNGLNFSPVVDSTVELFRKGALVPMKDSNWQNPYNLIHNTNGAFTFWPAPESAAAEGIREAIQFVIKISGSGFEDVYHSFTVPVTSENSPSSLVMDKIYKLPDLYVFPPGEEKAQRIIN